MQSTTLPVQQAHNSLVNSEGNSSFIQREGLHQVGVLVACFVLPAEQAEKLISVLQDIVRSPASEAPLNLAQPGITSVTQSNSWLTHIEAASYLARDRCEHTVPLRGTGKNRMPKDWQPARTPPDFTRSVQRTTDSSRSTPPRARYNCADARLRQLRGASLGLYKKYRSPYWWMTYMADGEQVFESTGTTSKNLATKIWRKRENEVASGKFRLDWPGGRITFEEMCKEFEKSHFASISENTIKGYQAYLKHLKVFFGEHVLTGITAKLVEEYRDQRRQQPSIRYKGRTLKGATVNRELECLTCILDLAVQRKYIPENPARAVKHFQRTARTAGHGRGEALML